MPKNLLHVPDTQVGLFLVGNGLMIMLLQLPVAYLLDRRSKIVALAVGAGCSPPPPLRSSSPTPSSASSWRSPGSLRLRRRPWRSPAISGREEPRPCRETRHLPRPLRVLLRRRLWHKLHSGWSTTR